MKAAAYAVLAAAALVSTFFVSVLKPASTTAAVLLGGWLMLPYALLAIAVGRLARDEPSARAWLLLVVLVCAGGLGFLALTLYGPPNAQGGIAVMFTPIYQAIAAVALQPVCQWLARRRKA